MRVVDWGLIAARLALGVWLMWRVRVPVGTRSSAPVAVIVPARDEAASIGRLLDTLTPQLRSTDELVVVDDHSTDDTAAIATSRGVRVVSAPDLPDGWTGKTWACQTGALATTAPTLLFVDADVRFGEGGAGAVLGVLDRVGGLVSVQPFHATETATDDLAMIANIVGFSGTGAATPAARAIGAFGPVFATSRADLDSVGGYEAVRRSVVEDLALAQRYRERDLPVTVLGGGGAVRFRMYPEGFRSLVGGFRKNLAGGLSGVRPITALAVVAWLTLLVQAAGWLARAPITGSWNDAGLLYAAVVMQIAWIARRLGSFSAASVVLFPASLAVFLAIFVLSCTDVVRGSTTWKGRSISLRGR